MTELPMYPEEIDHGFPRAGSPGQQDLLGPPEWECDDPDCPDNIMEQLDRLQRRAFVVRAKTEDGEPVL